MNTSQEPVPDGQLTEEYEDLAPGKNWVDELAWYMMVMGFVGILLAGLLFYLHKYHPLRYPDYSLNANLLGGYVLVAGLGFYVVGRLLHYYRRFQKRSMKS